jgi:hypothetical protein
MPLLYLRVASFHGKLWPHLFHFLFLYLLPCKCYFVVFSFYFSICLVVWCKMSAWLFFIYPEMFKMCSSCYSELQLLLLLMVDGMQFLPLLPLAGNKAVLLHPQQHLLRTGSERVTHYFHGPEGWVIQESVGRQCLSRLNFYSIEFMLVKTILFCWLCWSES